MPQITRSTIDLVREAKQGDDAARDALFLRYRVRLRRWASRRIPDGVRRRMDTEDLVHDVLLGTLRRLDHLDPQGGGAFQAYTRQALLNRIRDALRKHREETLTTAAGEGQADPEPSPLESAIGRDAMDRYLAALERLEPDAREAVIARLECHASWEEIAEEFGKESPDAARMMVRRSLARLAKEMGPG